MEIANTSLDLGSATFTCVKFLHKFTINLHLGLDSIALLPDN